MNPFEKNLHSALETTIKDQAARIAELEAKLAALKQRIANAPNCRATEVYVGGRMAQVKTFIDPSAIGKRVRLVVDQEGE